MKHALAIFFLGTPLWLMGGESYLTTTYQPLDGLGSGGIVISPVVCHDWYAHGDRFSAMGLISAANIPPTNNPEQATENLNLASICGLRFDNGEMETARKVTLDATKFSIPVRFEHPRENIARACLECFRRLLPEEFLTTTVILKANDADKAWLTEIVTQFNAHNRREIFFVSQT